MIHVCKNEFSAFVNTDIVIASYGTPFVFKQTILLANYFSMPTLVRTLRVQMSVVLAFWRTSRFVTSR